MLSSPLTLQPLGPGPQCPAGLPVLLVQEVVVGIIFCMMSITLAKSNPSTFPGVWLLKKSDVLNSDALNLDALCVTGLAGLCHAAHVPSCCIHWSQLVVSRSHPGELQMEVRQSSATCGGRPYAPEL